MSTPQAYSVFLLLFGVISTNILPVERQNQIDFHPNQHGGGAGKPHIDWRLAETDLSTGLKCVAVMERSDLDLTGRERLLGCKLESSINICQSAFITEFRPSTVEMCEETVQA